MEQSIVATSILFFALILGFTSFLRELLKKVAFPYTTGLLLLGFVLQFTTRVFDVNIALTLSPEFIFYLLLPVLLFEAAIHINFHQFKLQFKTITFLATFGLMVSILIVGFLVFYLVGLPLKYSLLFGAIVSATDPISVLALFKTLGAPKRLALLADGESMFNDATAVIAYRLILALIIAGSGSIAPVYFINGLIQFIYIFIGSIIFGFVCGFATSRIIRYIKRDRLVETTITVILALGSFVIAEHYLYLSGVVSVVMAGVTLGNIGKTTISEGVFPFIEEIWEYLGFLALSIVFFFAAFTFDVSLFIAQPHNFIIVIAVVTIARAVSVYISFLISNRFRFFRDEPNVPVSWQHVINWGGLKGVIPLILVFSLPGDFPYFSQLVGYTFVVLAFSMFVNGLTIRYLLLGLGLHLPQKEETIIQEETEIFNIERVRKTLQEMKNYGKLDKHLLENIDNKLKQEEKKHQKQLLILAKSQYFEVSLKLEALNIERLELNELFKKGIIPEAVYYSFEAEIDLQQDALEYPEVYSGRGYTGGGRISTRLIFNVRQKKLHRWLSRYPFLSIVFGFKSSDLIANRYALHWVRTITSKQALLYLDRVCSIIGEKDLQIVVARVSKMYGGFLEDNIKDIDQITGEYPGVVKKYHEAVLSSMVEREYYLSDLG